MVLAPRPQRKCGLTIRSSRRAYGTRLTSNVSRRSRKSLQMRQLAKVSSVRSMPSAHGLRGPSVLRRPTHGGLGARRLSIQEQMRSPIARVACLHPRSVPRRRQVSSVVLSLRAVGQPSRVLHSGTVSQGAVALRLVRAVRPPAASARWVRRAAFSMQQPNTLVPFMPGTVQSTTATANHSVKRTSKSGLRPLSAAAYLKR
jgi:hypothetical protein